jgi:hypothetical protein
MSRPAIYAETLAILAAVALAVHVLAGVDWPWAVVAGAMVSVLVRRVIHRKPAARL